MTAAAALQTGRAGHVAVTLANGKIMVIGGQQNNGIRLGSCEIYDPATDTWTPTASLSRPRIYHTATVLANGKALVVGGGSGIWTRRSCTIRFPPPGVRPGR